MCEPTSRTNQVNPGALWRLRHQRASHLSIPRRAGKAAVDRILSCANGPFGEVTRGARMIGMGAERKLSSIRDLPILTRFRHRKHRAAWHARIVRHHGELLYELETIESNHEAFVNDGTVMPSANVDLLLAAEHISALSSGVLRRHNPVMPRNNTPSQSELDVGEGSGEKLSRSDRCRRCEHSALLPASCGRFSK